MRGGIVLLTLRYLREQRGWRQSDLSSVVGVSQNYISAIELGVSIPSEALLHRLALALDVPNAFALLQPVVIQTPALIQTAAKSVSA